MAVLMKRTDLILESLGQCSNHVIQSLGASHGTIDVKVGTNKRYGDLVCIEEAADLVAFFLQRMGITWLTEVGNICPDMLQEGCTVAGEGM